MYTQLKYKINKNCAGTCLKRLNKWQHQTCMVSFANSCNHDKPKMGIVSASIALLDWFPSRQLLIVKKYMRNRETWNSSTKFGICDYSLLLEKKKKRIAMTAGRFNQLLLYPLSCSQQIYMNAGSLALLTVIAIIEPLRKKGEIWYVTRPSPAPISSKRPIVS